jgi:hypothetical protein
MQMHILSDSQHTELTQTLTKLQTILGGSVSVSLDSKPASTPVVKTVAEPKAKAKTSRRTNKGRRNVLNESKVAIIKSRLAAGESAAKIARDFSVAANVVYSIKYGLTWKHVELQQDHAPASVDA